MTLPAEAQPLLAVLLPHFTQPTATRFVTLLVAAVLTPGRRTVANLLRTLGPLAPGRRTTYQRVLSRAPCSTAELGTTLAGLLLRHPGPKVSGKARHRDPARSTHSHTAWRCGHKWVVLAVLGKFPFATRRWASPVLVARYRAPALNHAEGRLHRTPAQLMCRLLRLFLLRHPGRRGLFVGDGGFGTHEVARFCHRHRDRLTLVSKLHPDANLFDPPASRPREAVARTRRLKDPRVDWNGRGTRRVSVVTEAAHWYKCGHGLVPLRWVYVRDLTATHRGEYLYSNDPTLRPAEVVGLYCGRWNLADLFELAKGGCGSDGYEVRSWTGWHRHVTLSLWALAVVAMIRSRLPLPRRKKGAGG